MNLKISKSADADIVHLYARGVVQFGVKQADQYHDALFDLFDLLADNPRMGRERTELTPPMRVHPFRSHVVLYKNEDEDIMIIRVRHSLEDWGGDPT